MKKRVLGLFLSVVMTAVLFAGCKNNKTANEDVTEDSPASTAEVNTADASATEEKAETEDIAGAITFVSGNDQTGALSQMITEFNKVYPNIKVEHQILPGNSDDVKKSLMTSLAAGDTDPDVFECDIIWVSQFAAAGWLKDVTSYLEEKWSEFLVGPLSTCYYNNKAYAYPNYTDVGLLYYRTDLIETPPKTWDELVEMSKKHIGSDGIEYGYVFQGFQGEPISCNMLEFIKQNGGADLLNGEFAMNNDNTIEALKFVRSLIEEGISPEGVLSHKPDDTRAIFEEGKALFMRNWTYAYANAQLDTSRVKGKVGVTALPVGPEGTESCGTLGGWNFAINANTDGEEAAVLFTEFMSSYEMQKISTMVRGTFPTCSAVYEDDEILEKLPHLEGVRDAADNAKPRPQVRDYSAISAIFQVYFHKALTKDLDYAEAMEQMDKELNEAYAAQQ